MSASTVARWHAISLTRDPDESKKRHRSNAEDEDDDSSEDNVSIVSRSPSPVSEKDVEMKDVSLYDEHIRKPSRETITVDTKIKSTNVGFAMLAKMGWTEGTPLGVSGEGRVDPIPFSVKQDQTGLGKVTQDFRMIETTVSQRRNLDSERMQFETAEQRQQREATVAQKAQVQAEITTVLRPFYCELCDKQFKNVAQYDEHTNSYAHHHRVRMKDMNANHPMKIGGKEEAEKRKEKERKREEKEMRKLAKAAGIKLAPAPTVTSVRAPGEAEPKGPQKSGWATVTSSASSSTSGGWAAVSNTPVFAPPAGPASSSAFSGWAAVSTPAPSAPPRGGWRSVGSSSQPPPPPSSGLPPGPPEPSHTPSFRSSGWSTLASSTGDNSAVPPPPPSRGGWSAASQSSGPPPPPPTSRSTTEHPRPSPPGNALPPTSTNNWSRIPPSSNSFRGDTTPSQHQPHGRPPPSGPNALQARADPQKGSSRDKPGESRGNWQQFQKMRGRR